MNINYGLKRAMAPLLLAASLALTTPATADTKKDATEYGLNLEEYGISYAFFIALADHCKLDEQKEGFVQMLSTAQIEDFPHYAKALLVLPAAREAVADVANEDMVEALCEAMPSW